MNAIIKIIIAFCLIIYSYTAQSQSKTNDNKKWKYISEVEGVIFYYTTENCIDSMNGYANEVLLLKIENTNDQNVVAKWNFERYYNGKCFDCMKKNINVQSIKLLANSEVSGSCFSYTDRDLVIFSKMLNNNENSSKLTDFKLKNIVISFE